MTRQKFFQRFFWLLAAVELLLGISLLLAFSWFESTIVKAFLLFAGTALTVGNLLRIASYLTIQIPDEHVKRMSSSVALCTTMLFLIVQTSSVGWAALFWIFFFLGLLGVGTHGLFILGDTIVINHLFRSFRSGAAPTLPVPFVYLLAEPGMGAHQAYRISARAGNILQKTRKKKLAYFIVSASVRSYSKEFQVWLVSEAAALIIVRYFPVGSVDDAFDEMVAESYRKARGEIWSLRYKLPVGNAITEQEESRVNRMSIKELSWDAVTGRDTISTFADSLATSALPLANSDARLPGEFRSLVKIVSTDALPPVADAYLRFRISQSDVERLLCLFDCIETVIKCSAIVLLASTWSRKDARQTGTDINHLSRPSLGQWIELLRDLLKESPMGNLENNIRNFWSEPLLHVPKRLIDEAGGSGLAWKGEIPRSHLGWLDWFVWLRNSTRGHGVVEEKFASSIWRGFHETFLQIVAGLKTLLLSSRLVVLGNGEEETALQGWTRTRTTSNENHGETTEVSLIYEDGISTFRLSLYPLAVTKSGAVLLWNSIRGDGIEYIDYGSGSLERFLFQSTDPYKLWVDHESLNRNHGHGPDRTYMK